MARHDQPDLVIPGGSVLIADEPPANRLWYPDPPKLHLIMRRRELPEDFWRRLHAMLGPQAMDRARFRLEYSDGLAFRFTAYWQGTQFRRHTARLTLTDPEEVIEHVPVNVAAHPRRSRPSRPSSPRRSP